MVPDIDEDQPKGQGHPSTSDRSEDAPYTSSSDSGYDLKQENGDPGYYDQDDAAFSEGEPPKEPAYDEDEKKETLFNQFPKNFWVINALELFERGAYYGTMAILAVHIHDNLDYSASETGLLLSIMLTLLYFVPLIAAAFAEKIGYKRTLIFAFAAMAVGYTMYSAVSQFALLIVSILFLGIGAGTFKPIISASIAKITREDQRNQAFSIYYWMINLGALLVPWTFAFFSGANIFDPETNAEYVFLGSTMLVGINLFITFTMLEDPSPPNPKKDIFDSLRNLTVVARDRRFFILLLIYSGFWFMFAMCHSYLPLYMVHFLEMPDYFSVFLLAGFNPLTIVIAGPFLSTQVKKYDSLKLMITGMAIFCIGLVILGFTTMPALFIAGIIIFSLGEFITHPNFIAYVSKIAPKDKVAIYMGYAFLPSGIGYVLGAGVGGVLFGSVAEGWERPKVFWAIVTCIGLATIMLFTLYDRKMRKEGVVEAVEAEPVAAEEAPGKFSSFSMSTDVVALIAVIMIPVVLFAAMGAGTNAYIETDKDDGPSKGKGKGGPDPDEVFKFSETNTGNLNEQESTTLNYSTGGYNIRATFILTWTDEPDNGVPTYENEGDTFTLEVIGPGNNRDSDTATNEHDQEGRIELTFEIGEKESIPGGWNATVTLDEAGDQSAFGGGTGVVFIDDSNDYTLDVEIEYLLE